MVKTIDVTLTDAQKTELQDSLMRFGWVTCPCCGWVGLNVTKNGKIRKHGRRQTGATKLGCRGGGLSVR